MTNNQNDINNMLRDNVEKVIQLEEKQSNVTIKTTIYEFTKDFIRLVEEAENMRKNTSELQQIKKFMDESNEKQKLFDCELEKAATELANKIQDRNKAETKKQDAKKQHDKYRQQLEESHKQLLNSQKQLLNSQKQFSNSLKKLECCDHQLDMAKSHVDNAKEAVQLIESNKNNHLREFHSELQKLLQNIINKM